MRVNVYEEELAEFPGHRRFEVITKDGRTGLRIYLYLPVTQGDQEIRGPYKHRANDDDSSAVTFWGKPDDLVRLFEEAISRLKG